jgi:hypothetical protein
MCLQTDQNEIPHDAHHLAVPLGASQMISEPWYVWSKPCTYLAPTLTLSPNRHLVAVPSGVSKTISEPMVHSAQTVHLSCTDTNTVSKRAEMRFHVTRVAYVFHRVRPKRFLSLWYVRCKPCSYIVSKLALSLNGLKGRSTWASSPRSTVGCVQNDFSAYGMFGANYGPIFLRHKHYLQTYWNYISLDPCHLGSRSGASKMISEPMVR